MKIAVFSDIHGNLAAWRAALEQMRDWRADRYVFLGDLCGYYYQQIEIFNEFQKIPDLVAIRGNHDQIFLDIVQGDCALREQYAQGYGSSMEHLLEQDHTALAEWLRSLPEIAAVSGALCAHGSPFAPLDGYVYPDMELCARDWTQDAFYILGHTHYRMHRNVCGVRVLNPGSLGQPRDRLLASWAAWDTETSDIRFMDVRFDVSALYHQLQQANEPSYLHTVLQRIPKTP